MTTINISSPYSSARNAICCKMIRLKILLTVSDSTKSRVFVRWSAICWCRYCCCCGLPILLADFILNSCVNLHCILISMSESLCAPIAPQCVPFLLWYRGISGSGIGIVNKRAMTFMCLRLHALSKRCTTKCVDSFFSLSLSRCRAPNDQRILNVCRKMCSLLPNIISLTHIVRAPARAHHVYLY